MYVRPLLSRKLKGLFCSEAAVLRSPKNRTAVTVELASAWPAAASGRGATEVKFQLEFQLIDLIQKNLSGNLSGYF